MHRVQDSNVIPIEREAQSTAVGFLQRLYPQGPWVITAIIPDGETETRTFLPSQKSAMADFIRTRNASGRNVYFAINKPKRAVTKKAKKKELAEANFLHV